MELAFADCLDLCWCVIHDSLHVAGVAPDTNDDDRFFPYSTSDYINYRKDVLWYQVDGVWLC